MDCKTSPWSRAAAAGWGGGCADALAEAGHRVAVLDLAPDTSGPHLPVVADVTSGASLTEAVTEVERALGPVSVLVHAAGISGPWTGLLDLPESTWNQIMDVNAGGTFRTCKALLPGMVERGYGRVVLVASVAGKEGSAQLPAYSASKAAVIALAKALGKDLAKTGVLVNAVTPAGIDAGMTHENSPEIQDGMRAAIPMGRLGTRRRWRPW
ncbi:SDR family NAD(P)-dependent oxidoreductase [Streptomyces sp. NPDC055400]